MRAYDVGAFDGADTAHYLSLGYRVISIEASPLKWEELRAKFAREIADGRCDLLNIAVSEQEGILPFYLSENPQWSSLDYKAATKNGVKAKEISIRARPLRDVIVEHGTPDLIKIDIEGADYQALRGMGDEWPAYLSFEASQDGFDEAVMSLVARGYTRFSLVNQRAMRPVRIPPAGTLGHVKWSTRQWLRWQLRKHQSLHKAIAGARSSMQWAKGRQQHRIDPSKVATLHPTLMPTEHSVWYSLPDFLWLWRNVVMGGEIDSVWFDVHASRN